MATNIFSIGRSALAAAQAAQATTSHNISNATVAGYNRQVAVQSTAGGINYGAGFVGQGTQVVEIKRIYNDFLNKQSIAATTATSALDSYYAQIRQLDNMVADTAAGLSPALQNFFKSMQNLASLPDNAAARQSVLSAGQTLAARFKSLDEQMAQSRTGINSQITSSIGTINSYATQIEELNKAIIKVSGVNGAAPNDLLDQRDQAIAALNKIVKVTTLPQDNGALSVFIANGQPLVLGGQVSTLVATPSVSDPTRLQVSLKNNSNGFQIPDAAFEGGRLGGLMSYRSETLDVAQNTLGRIAIALATQFNAQHKLGQDQNAALGGDFFNVSTPLVNSTSGNSASAMVTVAISDSSRLTTSDYRLTYDGSKYTITRVADGNATTITPPATTFPVTLDGLTYSAPTMAAGDSFLVKPTINGAAMLNVAITSTQKIAAATPVVTSINAVTDMGLVTAGNGGTGTITAADVNKSTFLPNTTQTYTYAAGAPNTLTLTPPAAVTVTTRTGTVTSYAAGVAIPYAAGANYSSAGVSFVLSGTPANTDKFVFSPKPANTGTAVISPGTIDSSYAGTPLTAGTKLGFTFNSPGGTLTPTANVGAVTVKHADGTTTNYAAGANIAITSGDKLSTGGISFTITGQPANGDQFYVVPNKNGTSDNRNALALNALQTASTIGNTSFQGSYSQMVSEIGNRTHEVDVLNKAGKSRLNAIQQEQQSESGVNQDEELSNMMLNQRNYQAAAKIIQAASDMLNVLFTLGR